MMKGAIVGFGEVACNGHWPAWQACADVAAIVAGQRDHEQVEQPGRCLGNLVDRPVERLFVRLGRRIEARELADELE